jgi:hypothetical protein
MKTKNRLLKRSVFLLAVILVLAFASCDNPSSSGDGGGGGWIGEYNDTPIASFTGTTWSDGLIPESTIEFISSTQVRLTGRYWEAVNGQNMGVGGTHPYEVSGLFPDDKVEPGVIVIMDTLKRTGFEFYYYRAMTGANGIEKHQRMVAWFTQHLLQPREFFLE